MAPADGVRITTREIYDQLLATDRKVDALVAAGQVDIKQRADHEGRIRFLEKAAWVAPPSLVLAVLSLIVNR